MSGASIDMRIASARPATIGELAEVWTSTAVRLRLAGLAGFADAPSFGNKLRGALGAVLLESASPAVRRRQPCTWHETSAAEVFFGKRPLVSFGSDRTEISKPYVLWTEKAPDGALVIGCRIFGFAQHWVSAVVAALVAAVEQRVAWEVLARDVHLVRRPPIVVEDVIVAKETMDGFRPAPAAATLSFLSPIDAERGDPVRQPELVTRRLIVRLVLVAVWHGLDVRLPAEDVLRDEAGPEIVETSGMGHSIPSLAGGHRFANRLSQPTTFSMSGDLRRVWPFLAMGTLTHLGRGATVGLGRYRLDIDDTDD